MALRKSQKNKVKRVVKGLKKASKLHQKQAKTLSGVLRGKRSKRT
jgi:hypothetical protein|tara:strand:- start:1364 stop:1498 length:135 start_codon:yes stop_codon:yes gene_type:complete